MQFIQFLQSSVPHIRSEIHYIMMICQEQFLLLLMLKTKSCFIFFGKKPHTFNGSIYNLDLKLKMSGNMQRDLIDQPIYRIGCGMN